MPETADDFYRRAGNWLRENTRSKKTLHVLFYDKIAYGYGRNLFVLKWPALVLNVLIVIGSAAYLWLGASPRDLLPVFVLAFLHAAYLAIFSTWSAVEEASRIYARQLLLSTESTEVREQPLAEPGALAT